MSIWDELARPLEIPISWLGLMGIVFLMALVPAWFQLKAWFQTKRPSDRPFPSLSFHDKPSIRPFETAAIGHFMMDINGQIKEANPSLAGMLGFSSVADMLNNFPGAVRGFNADYDKRVEFEQRMQELQVIQAFQTRAYKKEGSLVALRINAHTVFDPAGHLLFEGVIEDISSTQRDVDGLHKLVNSLQRRIKKLKKQASLANLQLDQATQGKDKANQDHQHIKTQYRKLIDTMLDGLVMLDKTRNFRYLNQRFCDMLGYKKEEVESQPADIFLDDRNKRRLVGQFALQAQGENAPYELEWKSKSGQRIQTIMSAWPVFNELNEFTGSFTIITDITWRKKAEQDLQRAKDQADAANRAKSAFLATMSHEIRTPMNAILGFAELLGTQIQNPSHRQYLNAISSGGQTLLSLINDILDLSKIEAGHFELHEKAVDFRGILGEIQAIFSHKIRSKGIGWQMKIDPSLPVGLCLDAVRIRQVLFNLLGNAIKFTDHGQVSLNIQAHKKGSSIDLEICVTDTGMGIEPDQQKLIFDAFKQAPGAAQGKLVQGTGLGLAITRRLVELMNGRIKVDSQPGKGSSFTVYLEELSVGQVNKTDTPEGVDALIFEPARLLIVDDIPSNIQLIQGFLADYDIELHLGENGHQAVSMACQLLPDLVLMDLMMPQIDGQTALELIRKDPQAEGIPIVAMSASVMKGTEQQIRDQGFNGFLGKPISRNSLFNELSRHLVHRRKEQVTKPPGKITPWRPEQDVKKHLPALLDQMKSHARETCRKLVQTPIIDEIESFAQQMTELDLQYKVDPLKHWVDSLKAQIQTLNMANILAILNDFDNVVERIESATKALD
jgi:PAS domain S-box-containing protein